MKKCILPEFFEKFALKCLVFLVPFSVGTRSGAGPEAQSRPNMVLILTDDHGVGDVSCYGGTDLSTPAIDRLAEEGMRFTRMRANCTVCSPTRAAILTGYYADRVGVPGVIRTYARQSWGYLDPAAQTLADRLAGGGYHTALVGKWHLGLESPNTPNDRGFDLFHGFLGDMMNDYYHHRRHGINYMRLNEQVIEAEGHATDVFTDWAIDYLKQKADRSGEPFFLFLSYNAPHFPIQPPEEKLREVRERAPGMPVGRARNVAFVEHLDSGIGRFLDAMDELGLAEETMVVFTADNGGSLRHHQSNDPWREGKQSHFDGGLRVPFIVRWPGRVEAGTENDYDGLTFDVFPTFLEAAGLEVPEGLDAESLAPCWSGADPAPESGGRELYFVRREGGMRHGGRAYEALIRGPWKILRNSPFEAYQLYHLENDPRETENVLDRHPEVVKEMREALMRHIQRGGEVPWQQPGRE